MDGMENRHRIIGTLIAEVGMRHDPWGMADRVISLWGERYSNIGLGPSPDEDEVFAVAMLKEGYWAGDDTEYVQ